MAIISLENFSGPNTLAYPEVPRPGGNSYKSLYGNNTANSNDVPDHLPGFNIGTVETVRPRFIGNIVDYYTGSSQPLIVITYNSGRYVLTTAHSNISTSPVRLYFSDRSVNSKVAVSGARICFGWRHCPATAVAGTATVAGLFDIGDSGGYKYRMNNHPANGNVYYEFSVTYVSGGTVEIKAYQNKRLLSTVTCASNNWYVSIALSAGNGTNSITNISAFDSGPSALSADARARVLYGITDLYLGVDMPDDPVKTGLIGPIRIVDRRVAKHNGNETGAPIHMSEATGLDPVLEFPEGLTPADLMNVGRHVTRTAPAILSLGSTGPHANSNNFMVTDAGGALESFSFNPLGATAERVVAYQTEILAREMASQAGTVVAGHATEDNKFESTDKTTFTGLGFDVRSCEYLRLPVVTHKPDNTPLDADYVNNVTVVVGSAPITAE